MVMATTSKLEKNKLSHRNCAARDHRQSRAPFSFSCFYFCTFWTVVFCFELSFSIVFFFFFDFKSLGKTTSIFCNKKKFNYKIFKEYAMQKRRKIMKKKREKRKRKKRQISKHTYYMCWEIFNEI
jgi:hypothetical protein